MTIVTTWENIAASKRTRLRASIPPDWLIPADLLPKPEQNDVTGFPRDSGWFSPAELEITDSSAAEILQKTSSGVWSAEAVARAFCKRAAAAHQLVSSN